MLQMSKMQNYMILYEGGPRLNKVVQNLKDEVDKPWEVPTYQGQMALEKGKKRKGKEKDELEQWSTMLASTMS